MKLLLWFSLIFINSQLSAEDTSPGALYYSLATKAVKDGGFGFSPKEAVDWTYRLPKKVVFNYETFERNFKAALKELGTDKLQDAIKQAIDQTSKADPKADNRPRTLEEARLQSGDLALLDSVRRAEKALQLEDPYEMKEYRGFGFGPYRYEGLYRYQGFGPYRYSGFGEYYYFEERITPRNPGEPEGDGARIGVGVYFDRFRELNRRRIWPATGPFWR